MESMRSVHDAFCSESRRESRCQSPGHFSFITFLGFMIKLSWWSQSSYFISPKKLDFLKFEMTIKCYDFYLHSFNKSFQTLNRSSDLKSFHHVTKLLEKDTYETSFMTVKNFIRFNISLFLRYEASRISDES